MTTTAPASSTDRQRRLIVDLITYGRYDAVTFGGDFVDFGAPRSRSLDQICEWLDQLDASTTQAMTHRLTKLCYHPDVFDPITAICDAAASPNDDERRELVLIAVHQVMISFFQNADYEPTPDVLADEMGVMIEAAPDGATKLDALTELEQLIYELTDDEPNKLTVTVDRMRMALSPEMDPDEAIDHRHDDAAALAETADQIIADLTRTENAEL